MNKQKCHECNKYTYDSISCYNCDKNIICDDCLESVRCFNCDAIFCSDCLCVYGAPLCKSCGHTCSICHNEDESGCRQCGNCDSLVCDYCLFDIKYNLDELCIKCVVSQWSESTGARLSDIEELNEE